MVFNVFFHDTSVFILEGLFLWLHSRNILGFSFLGVSPIIEGSSLRYSLCCKSIPGWCKVKTCNSGIHFFILMCGQRIVFLQCLRNVKCADVISDVLYLRDEVWRRKVSLQVILWCEASSNSVISSVRPRFIFRMCI